jgi:hypothetical protein
VGYGDDIDDGAGCASGGFLGSSADRFYALTIPAGKQLTVTVTPQSTLDPLLSLIDAAAGCASPLTCLAGVPSNGPGQVDTLSWSNRTGAALPVLLAVDSRAGTTGTFDLLATIADPPAGDFCALALPLTTTTPVQGTTVGASNDYGDGVRCASGVTGPDSAWAFDVPPGQRATLTVTPTSGDGGFNPSLSVVPGAALACEATPRQCLSAANAAFGSAAPRSTSAYNPGATPLPTFVIVDGASGGAGSYTLSATVSTPAANDVCGTAVTTLPITPLASTMPLTAQTLVGFERDYDCVASASGADRVYLAGVQAMQRVSVTVTPTPMQPDAGSFDPVVALIGGPATTCDSIGRVCLADVDDGAQARAETLTFNNPGAARSAFLSVGAWERAPLDSTFSIVATSEPVPDADVCEKAIAIGVTNTRTGDSLRGLLRDYAPSATTCRSGAGADAVYAVTFSSSFTVTVTPDAMSDVVLNVVDGPATACATATACLASADSGGDGAAETLSVVNAAGGMKTVFLIVSRYDAGDMTFSVAATIN